MRTRLLSIFFLALVPLIPVFSQRGIINKGALIVVKNNGVINIQGGSAASYVSQTSGSFHGRMDLNGKLYLQGSWLNNTTGGNGLINPGTDGEIILQGSTLQTIGGTQTSWFEKLTLNNGAGASLLGSVNIYGNLGLTAGKLSLGSYPMLLSASSSVVGTPSATAMVVADGAGELRKNYTTTGSFLFPVGDNTATAEYSPVTLNFTAGTFGSGAWAGVRLVNAKHPSNTSAGSFLNRYWVTSQNNITSFTCTPSFVYADTDINGTESNIYGGKYVSPFWTLMNAASTATNTLSGNVSSPGEFTGGESSAFSVSFTMAGDALITEGAENGEIITVNLFNAEFEASLNSANWSLTNAPQGISIGSVTRVNNTQATVTLSGNRTKDYDANISNLNLTIGHQELKNLDAGTVSASTGVLFTTVNDAESISMADDGNITEGAIAGEKIFVTLTGGTFAASLNSANWALTNLPSGISIGSITRTSGTTAEITLTGTAVDYDTDITNASLSISEIEIDDHTGANLTTNTGVRFIAVDESLVITMANDGNGINESSENGEVITITISNKTFSPAITAGNWTLLNLPQGVTKGTVSRVDDTHVTITLAGNRTKDYDANITNVTLLIAVGEIVGHSAIASINSGVTFTATNDIESLSISSGTINEGSENGASITVTLANGTFAGTLTKSNWIISNLPAGVSIASVTRTSATLATIVLSGNRSIDYDSDINLSLSVNEAEIDDYTGANMVPSSGVAKLTANADNEVLTMSDNGITEGAENGRIITVTLTGGNLVSSLTPANWALTNLPAGVSKGSVTRISSTQAQITLSGNRTTDYDNNITNLTLTVNEAEIDDNITGVAVSTGVVFTAIDEPAGIVLSTPVSITEGAENGTTILVTLSEDIFAATLTIGSWSVTNLPAGVTAGSVARTDNTHATITLSGNRTTDFDNNITNITVQLAGSQLTQHTSSPVSANTGAIINAVADNESLTMSNDGVITEGSENGKTITVTLSGGTFAASLTPANWAISGQPSGVSIGSVQRLTSTTARITLSGNRNVDYDSDITNMTLSVNELEIDEYTGANLTVNTGVTFTSILETLSLAISASPITEGSENGSQITVTLSGGTFVSALDLASWTINGLPYGVSKGSISRLNSTQAVLTLSGNRSADYDINITAVTVTCLATEIVAYAGANLTSSTGMTFVANLEQLSISHAGLTEENLHNAVIQLLLTGDSFRDNILATGNFSLNNAPAGTSIASITYTDATHASLKIAYDSANYDFDNSFANFRVTVLDAELNGIGYLTSNALTITATVEPVYANISASGELTESNLNGNSLSLQLINETFIDNVLTGSNFQLLNAPAGLTVNSVQWLSSTSASISLTFDGTDFDSDYPNFRVQIAGAELQGNAQLTSNIIGITSVIEIPYLETDAGATTLTETSLDNAIINLTLVNETFLNASLDPLNFQLLNSPVGTTVAAVTWLSGTTASLQLAFDGTDFDESANSVQISIEGAELTGGTNLISSNSFIIEAVLEPAVINISAVGPLDESLLEGGQILIELTNISFTSPEPSAELFVIENAPTGVTVDTIYFNSPVQALMQLAYDQTDFDEDAVIHLNISPSAFASYSGSNLLSNDLLIPALIEDNSALLSASADLIETSLDGAVLNLVLLNDSFTTQPDQYLLTLTGVPFGAEITGIEVISSTEINITLGFRGDIDEDVPGFGIAIPGSILAGGRSISSNQLPVTAVVEIVTALISHPGLTESNLNGAEIALELNNAQFFDGLLSTTSFTLINSPAGCSVDSVVFLDETHAMIMLTFDGTNFFTSIDNFHIQIDGTEFNDGLTKLTNYLSIEAVGDPLLIISHPGLTELNLDGAELVLSLSNAQFTSVDLATSAFELLNGPAGLSVDSVIVVNPQEVRLILGFDQTDFNINYPDFMVSVDPTAVTGLIAPLASNTLLITFYTGLPNANLNDLRIYAYGKTIYIACSKPEELDHVIVYNMAGQAVITRSLKQKDINVLEMTGPDNSYIVRVFSKKDVYTQKVTLIQE